MLSAINLNLNYSNPDSEPSKLPSCQWLLHMQSSLPKNKTETRPTHYTKIAAVDTVVSNYCEDRISTNPLPEDVMLDSLHHTLLKSHVSP